MLARSGICLTGLFQFLFFLWSFPAPPVTLVLLRGVCVCVWGGGVQRTDKGRGPEKKRWEGERGGGREEVEVEREEEKR